MSSRERRRPIVISKNRFEAFSDGVFAIAITLLVLEIRPPDLPVAQNAYLLAALLSMWPEFLVYLASFATIGIMWFNHYALFHNVPSISYAALIANLALLSLVCFVPFTTLLLARVGLLPVATAFYLLTFFVLSVCFNALYYAATLRTGERGSFGDFLRKRNAWNSIGPIVYAIGAVLAFWSPIAGILLAAAMAVYYLLPSTVRITLTSIEDVHGTPSS